MDRLQINRAINLDNFTAVGFYNIAVAIGSCKNIPSDLSSNGSADCTLEVFSHNLVANVRSQVLILPNVNGYTKYERILTMDSNAVNYGGGSSGKIWAKVSYENVDRTNSITFDTANKYSIATATMPVSNIYSQNAVTVTSDRNAKNSIQDIDDVVLQAWSEVKPKQYKLNGDDNWSFGYIAQDIVDAFTKHGLDYKKYNIVHEEDGNFMLKYDMCHVLNDAILAYKLK